MTPSRIHILIAGHLASAPRALKEAHALVKAGHQVQITGVWHSEALAAEDRALARAAGIGLFPALDFRRSNLRGRGRWLVQGMERRWARHRFIRSGRLSPALLGHGAGALMAAALAGRADLTIVHSEAGLWIGGELLRRGRRVGIDFEDWFSRDLPESDRLARPVAWLADMEGDLLRRGHYALAPSRAMAEAMAEAYDAPPPEVVYNTFPPAPRDGLPRPRPERTGEDRLALHWFSQTIGPMRGLELLFAALPGVRHPVHVYLRGACPPSHLEWLRGQIPSGWESRVTVLGRVPNEELPARIAEYDVGLALETSSIPSRDLTVTNKVFQYLQAGLPVIATATQGQCEVLEPCGDAALILPEATPWNLARAIDRCANPGLRKRARQAAGRAVTELYSWAGEEKKIIEAAEQALAGPIDHATPNRGGRDHF